MGPDGHRSDTLNTPGYGAAVHGPIKRDFPWSMQRLRDVQARISRRDSATALARDGIDVFFDKARFTSPDTIAVGRTRITFGKAIGAAYLAVGNRAFRCQLLAREVRSEPLSTHPTGLRIACSDRARATPDRGLRMMIEAGVHLTDLSICGPCDCCAVSVE